jgi:hypothetical protein
VDFEIETLPFPSSSVKDGHHKYPLDGFPDFEVAPDVFQEDAVGYSFNGVMAEEGPPVPFRCLDLDRLVLLEAGEKGCGAVCSASF